MDSIENPKYDVYVVSVTDDEGNEVEPFVYAGLKNHEIAEINFFRYGKSQGIDTSTLTKLLTLGLKTMKTHNLNNIPKENQPTVYLMNIDDEATVVIAENISEAMDKAEKVSKKGYEMVYNKSLPLLF